MKDLFTLLRPINQIMIFINGEKDIHTHAHITILYFYHKLVCHLKAVFFQPLNDKWLWADLQKKKKKNHVHPGSETGEFKRSRMWLRLSSSLRNGCDTWLVPRSTLRVPPRSQSHQELLYSVNQLTPGHGCLVYKAVWCHCFSAGTQWEQNPTAMNKPKHFSDYHLLNVL